MGCAPISSKRKQLIEAAQKKAAGGLHPCPRLGTVEEEHSASPAIPGTWATGVRRRSARLATAMIILRMDAVRQRGPEVLGAACGDADAAQREWSGSVGEESRSLRVFWWCSRGRARAHQRVKQARRGRRSVVLVGTPPRSLSSSHHAVCWYVGERATRRWTGADTVSSKLRGVCVMSASGRRQRTQSPPEWLCLGRQRGKNSTESITACMDGCTPNWRQYGVVVVVVVRKKNNRAAGSFVAISLIILLGRQ